MRTDALRATAVRWAAAMAIIVPCASGRAASLFAAGQNAYGQVGNGTLAGADGSGSPTTLVPVTGLGIYVSTAAGGGAHSLAVQNGALFGWGLTNYGETGTGLTGSGSPYMTLSTPQPTPLTGGVTAVAAGTLFSMAVANGALYSFGANTNDSLANGTATSYTATTPMRVVDADNGVSFASGVTAIAAGSQHALAIQNGALYAWGYNRLGQVGNGQANTATGNAPNVVTPTQVLGMSSGVTMVAAGSNHSLAVKDGVLYGWGDNRNGAVGNNGPTGTSFDALEGTPAAVVGLPNGGTINSIAAGGNTNGDFSLAVVNGAVYSWGSNYYGQLGNGTNDDRSTAGLVSGITGTITDVAAGSGAAYALAADGSIWDWGYNAYGQLALGNTTTYSTPQHLLAPAGYRFSGVAASPTAGHVLISELALPVYFTGLAGNSLNTLGNYATSLAGTTAAPIAPVQTTDVFFATSNANAANLNAVVGTSLGVNSLTFGTGVSSASPVTIGGPGTITLYADKNTYAFGTGIVVQGGAAAVTINAPLALGVSQSWTNNAASTFTVNGSVTLGTQTLTLGGSGNTVVGGAVGGSGGLSVAGPGTATLSGANTFSGGTAVTGGTLVAASTTALPSGGAVAVGPAGTLKLAAAGFGTSTVGALAVSAGGKVDLTTNILVTATADTAVRALIIGGQITSTSVAAKQAVGYAPSGANTAVRLTLQGDANLDGSVTIADFNNLAGDFGKSVATWVGGDFNYDGAVTIADFNLLAGNFGQSLASPSAGPNYAAWNAFYGFAAAHNDLAAFEQATGVPEPTTLAAAGLFGVAALRRRRGPGRVH